MAISPSARRRLIVLALLLPACKPPRSGETPSKAPSDGPKVEGSLHMSGHSAQAVDLKARDLTEDFDVPPGFSVTLFAESPQMHNPSAMDVDERGRVWVTEAVNYRQWDGRNPGLHHDEGDRVVILEDQDGDGDADSSKIFVQDPDLVSPLGIAVIADAANPKRKRVLVSCSPTIWEYVDEDGDDVPDRKVVFLTGFGGPNHDHGVHSIVVGPDGRFYFAVGNAGPHIVTDKSGWTLRSGSIYRGGGEHEADNHPGLVSDDGKVWVGGLILRCEPDGTKLTVMAHNFRNEYEVALDSFGNMFTADNDDDGNACCRTTWVMEGGNYGYFSADGSRTWEADRRPGQDVWRAHWHQDDPGVMPAGTRNGAGGPTGVCVYEGELFGEDWVGRVLNADAGANCVYAHMPKAKGAGIELLPGKMIASRPQSGEKKDRWFRPSDVCASTDGSILVADWWDPGVGGHLAGDREAYGRILRIVPAGSKPRPPPLVLSSTDQALRCLESPAVHARALAAAALRAMPRESIPTVEEQTGDPSRIQARRLWVLGSLGALWCKPYLRLSRSTDPDLRMTAARAQRAWLASPDPAPHIETFAHDDPPRDFFASFGLPEAADAAVWREWLIARAREPARVHDLAEANQSPLASVLPVNAARFFYGGDPWFLEALAMAKLPMQELQIPAPAWDERSVELLRRSLEPGQVVNLVSRVRHAELPLATRRSDLEALAFFPDRSAGEAMLDLSLGGPEDTRELAAWWVRHNDETIWRSYQLAAQLPVDDREGAKMVWSSGILTKGSVDLDVDVSGASRMWLVVSSGKLGNGCDWSDWIEPRFVGPKGELRLVDTSWRNASAEWGSVNVGQNTNGGPLAIDDTTYADGIGTHAFSEIAFDVPKGYDRFRATAGLDDGGTSQGGRPDVEFQVWTKVEADPAAAAEAQRALSDPSTAPSEVDSLVESLAGSRGGGLLLLRLGREGKLSPRAREAAARFLPANPDLSVRALATESFAPGSDRRAPDPDEILALRGAASRGTSLFFDSAAQCSTCHVFHGRGGDVGPDLSTIAAKYGKPEILDAILHPSKAIAHGFDAWLVETKDGLLETGFLLADGEPVVLKDTSGKRHVIPADEIESRTKQTVSTMPDGVALGLSAQDLADLLEFLRVDPRARGKRLATRKLFDGASLEGWTAYLEEAGAKMEDVWTVEDGVLRCKGNPIGYLRTVEDFTSFVLGADQVWPNSIEAQLHHRNAGDIWNIGEYPMEVDPSRTEGRRTRKSQPCNERPLGEWNRYVITLDGGELTLEVNGTVQNTAHWVAERPGKVCLQSEGAAIEFRDISITPIERE